MNDSQRLRQRIDMAMGRRPADICLTNARLVDVYSGHIQENCTVRMGDGVIVGFGPGPATAEQDAGGAYLLPGLIDAHVHIESSLLCPPQFARLVLPLGTTTVVADPHEIANVLGAAGIAYMLESSADLPLDVRLMLPSCVPATPFEHAGATLSAADLAPFMDDPRVAGLGEVMNFPGVLQGAPDVLDKITLTRARRKTVDGHAPAITRLCGPLALDAYSGAGIATDHECETVEEMHERIQRGMYVAIRQGSAARNLPLLIGGVTPANAHRCLLCTDDRHVDDILEHGHMNALLRLAVEHGCDPVTAVRMATLHAAQCYGLRGKGGIAPGMGADCVLVEDLRSFRVTRVYARGRLVAEDGQLRVPLEAPTPRAVTGAVRPAPLHADMLRLPLPTGRARVIGLRPGSIVTEALERTVRTTAGFFDAAANPGLTRLAVIERHHGTGHVGVGLLEGYAALGMSLGGAIATTIAHDSHNIVVAGDSEADMLTAVEDLRRMGGGITLVRCGSVLEHLPLPVAGLMSDRPAEEVREAVHRLLALAQKEFRLAPGVEPFMALSFMALPVIPELKMTDNGLFDVRSFSLVDVGIVSAEEKTC